LVSPDDQLPLYKLGDSQIFYNTSSICMLSAIKKYFLDILALKNGTNWLSQNIRTELPLYTAYNPRKSRSQNMFNFSVPFHQENAKWSNINVFSDIILENTV